MTITVLCLGQSQMAGWFVFGAAPNRGADAFQSQLAGLLGVSPSTVVMLNGAVGGTAADRQAAVDPTNATLDIEAGHGMWWWDLEADSGAGAPGPIMTRAEGIADDSGLTIDLILWAQGHQDAAGHYYPPAGASPDPTPDRFETATRAIFARLRTLYGANIPIVIQELDTPWDLGPPPSYVLYAPQIAVLRQRQLDIVLDIDDTYFGASTTQYGLASYRQESFGYLHFPDETYRLVAQAMARSAAGILGSPADLVTDPTVTARLRLPYLAEAMLNADVAINEGLDILDSRVGTAVFSDQLTSPPAGPAVGDLYLVPASPTGAWAGQTDRVARWDGGAWLFYPPEAGWRLYVVASDAFRYWDGDQWLTEQIGTASASGVTNDSGVTGDSVADALDALDAAKADSAGLATIATSGDYGDLTGTPTLGALAAGLASAFTGVVGTLGDGVTAGWSATTFNTNPRYSLFRGNGSAASPAAAAGIIGQFDFGGYYSTTQTTTALRLRIDTQGAFTSLATASARLRFQTADNTGALADRVTIAANGELQMGSGFDTIVSAARHLRLRSYTVATLPSAAAAAELIYVSDDAGGAVPAFSDGADWRRMTDRAVVSAP